MPVPVKTYPTSTVPEANATTVSVVPLIDDVDTNVCVFV